MQSKNSTIERWRYSATVLLPVVLALVTTAAAVLGFVFWTTVNIDQRALEQQSTMIAEVVQTRRNELGHDLASIANRDDTLINAKLAFNFNWVNANIGLWAHTFLDHGRSVLLDASGRPLYMMIDGAPADPHSYGTMAATVDVLVSRLRAMPPPPAPALARAVPRAATDFALIEGMPAIVGVMAITSDTGRLRQQPGSENIIAAALFLDEEAAGKLSHEYMFEDGHFVLTDTVRENRASYPILNDAGRFIAFFEWERDRPGLMMLRQTGPALIAAFGIAAILVVLLLGQLRRSAAALEAGRRHAEHQAAHDRLTGLPNRTSFDTHLARALNGRRERGTHLALLMLDLDRFKQVNDTLGHQAGDALICSVGRRIRSIIGPDAMLARLGGDEFAILIAQERRKPDVMALANRIIEAIGQPFDLNNFKAHVGASIGIVNVGDGSVEPRELVRKADIALYEAKAGGRNCAIVYEEHMNELVQMQHTIEGELREALQRNDQLDVAFQPLVDEETRKVIGAEALARWRHPKFGQVSPARFIPVAENTGLIEALGEFVLRRACELGSTAPGRTIAVNISPTQLRNPRFASQVFEILHETGMLPEDLELEITESILLDDEHVSAANLRTFRNAGIHIALDDFGTGYSSLSYLKRYPVDRIKIDRSFVSQLADGHVSVAIIQAIVTLAHAMDIEVTAEGVETESQANILGHMGCNTLQGFLFSGGVSRERILGVFEDSLCPLRRNAG